MENEKTGLLGKFKQSDESVKLAVAVGVGVAVGVVGVVSVQAYGKKRENDAVRRSQLSLPTNVNDTPRIFVRVPSQQ